MNIRYQFPFNKVEKGSTIVLYGAGDVGRDYLAQLSQTDYCRVICVVDRAYREICSLCGFDIVDPEWLKQTDKYDYVVVASMWFANSIILTLKSMNIPKAKVISAFFSDTQPYASLGEDTVVYTIFKCLNKSKFSYIDVGANDPYRGSNTALLYNNGCRGINVEANPDLIEALKRERPEDITVNVGIGVDCGTLPYYMYENNAFNTFSKSVVQQHTTTTVKVCETPVVTLQEIIDRYMNGVWPDFLQIDIEGWDYDVIKSCDFSQSAPVVICAEINDVQKMNSMLDEKGYNPFHRTTSNMIYIKKRYCAMD